MSLLETIVKDLRSRRLWPVAVLLLGALVAIPLALSKPAPASFVAQQPAPPATAPAAALPVVSVQSTPAHSKLHGPARDPFRQQRAAATTTASATTTTTPASTTAPGTKSGGSAPGTGTTTTTTTTPTTPPTNTPAPKPTTLTDTQSYHVKLAITASGGGINTIDPLERLSVLPSKQQPLLIELGVLKSGRRVLFAVRPGAVVHGPAICTPGPIDCELISLVPGQDESVSMTTPTGVVPVALFSVTAIGVDHHPSVAAALKAREQVSADGRRLLNGLSLGALSLFQYRPSVGAVLDLRNLTVGGS